MAGSGTFNDRKTHLEVNKAMEFGNTAYRLPGLSEVWDDFLGDTLDSNLWSSTADTGGTAAAIAVATNGTIVLTNDATDDDRCDFAGEIIWKPSVGKVLFETRIKASNVDCCLIAGLSDAKTEAAQTTAVSATGANVLTTTATDGVFWCWDADLTTDKWLGIGVKADADATVVVGPTTVSTSFTTLRIVVDSSGNAAYYHNGTFYGYQADATTAATLLTPYIAVQNRSGNARTATVDYVYVAQIGARA